MEQNYQEKILYDIPREKKNWQSFLHRVKFTWMSS